MLTLIYTQFAETKQSFKNVLPRIISCFLCLLQWEAVKFLNILQANPSGKEGSITTSPVGAAA